MSTPLETIVNLWANEPALVFDQVPLYATVARQETLYTIITNYVDNWSELKTHVNAFWFALAQHIYVHRDDHTFPFGMPVETSYSMQYCISLPVAQCGYVLGLGFSLLPQVIVDVVILPFLLPQRCQKASFAQLSDDDVLEWDCIINSQGVNARDSEGWLARD